MKSNNEKWGFPPPEHTDTGAKRRIGQIVHDDRGTASVRWREAPDDYERPVFELEEPSLEIEKSDSFNPYDRKPETFASRPPRAASTGKRDLKKLSEWVKMMRAMEERKKNGE